MSTEINQDEVTAQILRAVERFCREFNLVAPLRVLQEEGRTLDSVHAAATRLAALRDAAKADGFHCMADQFGRANYQLVWLCNARFGCDFYS